MGLELSNVPWIIIIPNGLAGLQLELGLLNINPETGATAAILLFKKQPSVNEISAPFENPVAYSLVESIL